MSQAMQAVPVSLRQGCECLQSLGGLGKHKSRLEKEKEAATAARKSSSGGSSPAVPKRLPSYMRPTSASKAMQVPKVLPT